MKHIITLIQGMIFGVANVIPGFSGGTVAYMLGIYEKMLNAIGDFLPNKHKKRGEYFTFLCIFGIGAAVAILLFSGVMQYIMASVVLKQYFYFLIMGTILGSIATVVLYEKDMSISVGRIAVLLGTVLIFLWIVNSLEISSEPRQLQVTGEVAFIKLTAMDFGYYIWLFLIGIIAAGSMILPGFSGSALLISLGEYYNIMTFISERMAVPLIFFAAGCAIGILVLAKLLTKLLQRFYGGTTYMIIGLMVASIYVLYSEIRGTQLQSLTLSLVCMAVGFIITFMVSRYGKELEK